MNRIPSAHEAHNMSKSVIKGESKEQIAREIEVLADKIDEACHRGEHKIKLNEYLSDYSFNELETLGYRVDRQKNNVWYDDQTVIEW